MKILEFVAENFARLRVVMIRPGGSVVQVTGKNDQGKTSVLRAIEALIDGKEMARAPVKAVRKGAKEARLSADLGDFRIERIITARDDGTEGWSLKVTARDGTRVARTPQAVLDGFRGEIGFDPLGWCRLPAKAQADALKSLVDYDFAAAAVRRKKVYDARTVANARAHQEAARADGIELPPGPKPEPIDVAGLLDRMQEAAAHNSAIDNRRRLIDRATSEAHTKADRAEALRSQAAALEAESETELLAISKLEPMGEPIDVADIRRTLGEAERVKGVIGLHEQRERHRADAAEAKGNSDLMTAEISRIDAAQRAAIAAAKLPVEGLSLDPDGAGVMLGGIALADAGTARKIKTAMAIAMAKNPALRVVLVDEGSELDSDALAAIEEMAAEKDFQVWVARVDESGECGFVMQDGEVVK